MIRCVDMQGAGILVVDLREEAFLFQNEDLLSQLQNLPELQGCEIAERLTLEFHNGWCRFNGQASPLESWRRWKVHRDNKKARLPKQPGFDYDRFCWPGSTVSIGLPCRWEHRAADDFGLFGGFFAAPDADRIGFDKTFVQLTFEFQVFHLLLVFGINHIDNDLVLSFERSLQQFFA